jgi:NTE family protein
MLFLPCFLPSLLRVLLSCCALILFSLRPAAAQTGASASDNAFDNPTRPKIALVLSGGGARGFAHIGVLKVLREMRIPIDLVVGTSMGAVVGGAYAAGRSVDELEQIVRTTAWDEVLADRPARDELDYRRREEDILLPSRIEFGVTRSGVSLPPAAASNAGLERALARLLPAEMYDRPVNRLPLPFASAASDLVTGEVVELRDTSLFLAMRASLSLPGVFTPVRIKQHLVVDGGLVRNLPVDMARDMGADIVIAVNVGTPLAPEKDLGSAISVANQMLQILTEQNVQRSLKELGPSDILISPDLTGVNFLDFKSFTRTMQAGEKAARLIAPQLEALRLPVKEYAVLESNRMRSKFAPPEALPIGLVQVKGSEEINPASLIEQTGMVAGRVMTQTEIRQAATRLYGRGDLAYVETEVEEVDGKNQVTIRPVESTWGRNRLRVGVELASDLSENNQFNFGLLDVASSMNSWGAELRTILRVRLAPAARHAVLAAAWARFVLVCGAVDPVQRRLGRPVCRWPARLSSGRQFSRPGPDGRASSVELG